MQVKCNICGGENRIHPGQEMLFCSYCGSALALEDKKGPEHLILPHRRNDRIAEEALVSFFLNRNRTRPKELKVDFSFVPFLLIEDEKERTYTVPGLKDRTAVDSIPYPPAGNYRFFDEKLSKNQKIVMVEQVEKGTLKILHLPVYRIHYKSGKWEGRATVVGESWQVAADELPPEQATTLNVTNLLAAAGLFVILLFIGKAVPRWPTRLVLLFGISTFGFALHSLREKVVKRA